MFCTFAAVFAASLFVFSFAVLKGKKKRSHHHPTLTLAVINCWQSLSQETAKSERATFWGSSFSFTVHLNPLSAQLISSFYMNEYCERSTAVLRWKWGNINTQRHAPLKIYLLEHTSTTTACQSALKPAPRKTWVWYISHLSPPGAKRYCVHSLAINHVKCSRAFSDLEIKIKKTCLRGHSHLWRALSSW